MSTVWLCLRSPEVAQDDVRQDSEQNEEANENDNICVEGTEVEVLDLEERDAFKCRSIETRLRKYRSIRRIAPVIR